MIKKIPTYKSGKFVFSGKFRQEEMSNLIVEANVLYKTVIDLPILPTLATKLHEELVRRSIFGTAALEGNPLTEQRVGEIISERNSKGKRERAEQEIYNLKLAYDFVAKVKVPDSTFSLTEDIVKKIHAVVTSNIEHIHTEPGMYRNYPVKVGDSDHGGIYTPPKCLPDIETLMKELIAWVNSKEVVELDPSIRAALAHFHLGLIHPFGDGNGRVARLVEALILQVAGMRYVPIMLSNYYYRNIDDYFLAFSLARKNKENDVTAFLKFTFKGIIESLNELKERITYIIRKLALRAYYAYLRQTSRDITQRQHDLLVMLLEHDIGPIVLRDISEVNPLSVLYRGISERTARRDLNKLYNMGLLIRTAEGHYELNFRALDSLSVSAL